MVTIFFRTLIVYVFLILIMRLMGKRQIGELEVTDLVTTLLVSEIASLPITNQEIPVSYAIIPMTTLLTLEVLCSFVLIRFPKMKKIVSASPTVIIHQGVLRQKALLSLRISMEELLAEIRQQGYSDLSQIREAILEKNGKLTLLPNSSETPPTVSQLKMNVPQAMLMHVVFCGGSYNDAGLALVGHDRAWLDEKLLHSGFSQKDLFCVTADETGKIYLIPKQKGGESA